MGAAGRLRPINCKAMEKYVRVDWPESQKWYELVHYDHEYGIYMCDMIAFVPEELYNKLNNE